MGIVASILTFLTSVGDDGNPSLGFSFLVGALAAGVNAPVKVFCKTYLNFNRKYNKV